MAGTAALTAALERASELLASDPRAAAQQAERILRDGPQDPRAILILASARRRLGDCSSTRSLLTPLAARFPSAALTHYELGLALADLGERSAAIDSLQRALAAKPDLADAWRALGDELFLIGDEAGASAAFARYERALVTNPALAVAADSLLHGKAPQAEEALRARLREHPDELEALRLLAVAVGRQGRDVEAEALFALYLSHQPEDDGARFSYAEVLFRRTKAARALEQLKSLLASRPTHPAYRNLQAACLAQTGEHGEACRLYEGLLAEYGQQPRIWLNYGHALRTLGRQLETVSAYKQALALRPHFGETYWSLANLKSIPFSLEEEAAMTAALHHAKDEDDQLHLHFALGKALEDRREFSASFAHYAEGAAIRHRQTPYDAAAHTRRVNASKQLFDSGFFSRERSGSSSNAPIFIVGLPRSGSTLIEQILASHSAVEGTLELPDIGHLAEELGQAHFGKAVADYPRLLGDLGSAELRALAAEYLERTQVHRHAGLPHFVDKMPNNFMHVGFIHLMLPAARIIDARRHPLGACFSAFKQLFAQGHTFSYDLTDLGHYYRNYVELMAHFDAVLPGRIHRVMYEDLVEDTEGEVRRLLEYCGLPFEDACLRFHDNPRPVRTVSSEQVRQRIYRAGLEHWLNYEEWLGPLKTALGPVLENWRI